MEDERQPTRETLAATVVVTAEAEVIKPAKPKPVAQREENKQ